MSKTSKAKKVARGRLTEKLNRVQDVRSRLEEQLGYLDKLEGVYGGRIEEVAGGLEAAVAGLVKKTETLVQGMRDVSNRTGTIVIEKKKVFEDVIQKATVSTSSAFELLENKCSNMTHQQYSTASQDLEDTLIDALTLLDRSSYQSLGDSFSEITFQETSVMKIHDEVLGPLEVKIKDLKDRLETLAVNEERLHLLAFEEDASCTASEFGDTVMDSTVMENTVMDNTVMDNTVMENTVMENTSVQRDSLVFADSIPSLTLEVGSVLRVVLVSMDSLTSLTVQPDCSDLISLSEALSELALNEELTQSIACRDFISNLKTGQICCARFSADCFWYRGKVLDIAYKGNAINKVSVQYVDYGNKEILPLSSLLPLPVHLAVLPTQAVTCSFKGQSSFLQKASSQDISLTLIEWLERVLIGKVLKAQISSCTTSGDVHICAELYAPTKLFVNEKSLSFLQNMKLTLPTHWITTDIICLESLIKDMLSHNMTGQSTAANDIKNMPDTDVTAYQSLTSISNGQDTTTCVSAPAVSVASSLTNNQASSTSTQVAPFSMRLAPSWSNIQTPFPCSGNQTHTSPVPTSTVTSDCPTLTSTTVSPLGPSNEATITPNADQSSLNPMHNTEYPVNISSATPSMSCSSGTHSKGNDLVEIKKGEIRVVNPPSPVITNEIEERESSIKLQEYDDEQNHLISDESSEMDHLVSDESILDEWDRLVSSEQDQSVVQDQMVSCDQNHLVLDLRNHIEQEQLVSNQQDQNVSNEHDRLALDNQNSIVSDQVDEQNLEVSEQDQADEYQDQLSNHSDSSDILKTVVHPIPSIDGVDSVPSIEPAHKVDSIPEPVHEVDSISEPVHEVDSIPEPVHQVDSIPEPVHQVDFISEPVHEVDSIPESVHEVDSIPEPVHQVDSIPEPVHQVDFISEPVHEVDSISEPVHEVDSIPEPICKVDSIPEPVSEVDSIPESVHEVDSIPSIEYEVNPVPSIHESVHESDGVIEAEEIEALLLSIACSVIDDDCITDSSDDIILSPPSDFICQGSPNSTLDPIAPLDGSMTEAPATLTGDVSTVTVSESFSFVEYGPADELSLVVSSVVSPSCFYAVPSDNAQSLESLESSLVSHYSDPVNCHVLSEGQVRVGSVCCTKSMTSEGLCYSRGIIQSIQWSVTEHDPVVANSTDISGDDPVVVNSTESTDGDLIATDGSSPVAVHVFCVDYGYKAATDLNSLFVLEARFAALPVQCIPCSLSGVQLPTNEDTQLLDPHCDVTGDTDSPTSDDETVLVDNAGSWSNEVVRYFDGLVRNKLLLGVVTDKTVFAGSCIGPVYLVLLYDEEKNHINKELAKAGLAVSAEGGSSDHDSSNAEDDEFFNNWNPMVTDFLSQRNVLDIDDEDVGSALLGYKSTNNKVCRFYNTPEGCYDGDRCKYQHVREGEADQCLQDTFKSPSVPSLPPVGSMIIVVVTTIQSINCFMVHIMGPAEVLMKGSKIQSKYIRSKFLMLLQEMDEYYTEQGRATQSFIPPAIGELVAVWSERDNHWYRAIAKDQQGTSIEVFYIDVGYSELVDQDRIRTIAPEFVHLPVQAVECQLYNPNLSMESIPTDKTKKMFEDLVKDKLLFARVMWRNSNGILGVELHDLQSTGVSLNETIIGKEFENRNGCPKEKGKKRLAVQLMPG